MNLRKAKQSELATIWEIILYAIEQRRLDGSQQWQDGYPNKNTIREDLEKGYAYVVEDNGTVLLYAAIIFGKEPAYEVIEGKWLTDGDYAVLHRVAASPLAKGKGIATAFFQMVERVCIEKQIYSIKVDTNFDNLPMLKIMEKLDYTYCGEVTFRGGARKAFEKVLTQES
jgi:GNAT superfamily N-acetyltransferase